METGETEIHSDGEKFKKVNFISNRAGKRFSLKHESEGIRKIISMLGFLVEVYNKEIEVLSEYLPKELSDDEIKTLIAQIASEEKIESGKENMGRLMGAVMKKAKGKADGNRIRKAVMEFLG